MPLYEDVIQEQKDIAVEVSEIVLDLWLGAKELVENRSKFVHTVVGLVNSKKKTYHPSWNNAYERGKAFDVVNKDLEDYYVQGTVAAYHGKVRFKESPVSPTISTPAVILCARIANGQTTMVYPYRKDGEKIEWLPNVEMDEFHSSITHPCVH